MTNCVPAAQRARWLADAAGGGVIVPAIAVG
jgi:hypothetical protein